MTVDTQELRDRYAGMPDEDFRAVRWADLTGAAQEFYGDELARRDLIRFQEVQREDAEEAERRSRIAAAAAEDPDFS